MSFSTILASRRKKVVEKNEVKPGPARVLPWKKDGVSGPQEEPKVVVSSTASSSALINRQAPLRMSSRLQEALRNTSDEAVKEAEQELLLLIQPSGSQKTNVSRVATYTIICNARGTAPWPVSWKSIYEYLVIGLKAGV